MDYRDGDVTVGVCPDCHRQLTGFTVAGRGHCDVHGWVWADWIPVDRINDDEEDNDGSEG